MARSSPSLDLHIRGVLVAGGGTLAARYVASLLPAGANVRVVSATVASSIADAARRRELTVDVRPFDDRDLDGVSLAIAADDDAATNAAVLAAARARGTLAIDAAAPPDGASADSLEYRSGNLRFVVDGAAPAFLQRVRDDLAAEFDDRYARAARVVEAMHEYARAVLPAHRRAAVLADLARRPIEELAAIPASQIEDAVDVAARDGEARLDRTTHAVCASRASALALWQTRHVIARLAAAGVASTILEISTRGDRVQDRSLAAIGTDSLFVKELEAALRDGRADYAVHSCKDLPSVVPEDMRVAAISKREDPRDAFCSERYASFADLPAGALVGTSSPRRVAQLAALRPDVRFAPIRGNVDTRLRKLRDGEFDAIVLAMAGLQRLGLRATHTVAFEPDVVVPAVAQGALAVECRADDERLARALHDALADADAERCVGAERAFLRTLRAGCQAPVGAHATLADDGTLEIAGVIAAVDGAQVVRGNERARCADLVAAEALGERLARDLLARGGAAVLAASAEIAPLAGAHCVLARMPGTIAQIAPALRAAGAVVAEASDAAEASAAFGERAPDALLFASSDAVAAVATYLAGLRARGAHPLVAALEAASAAAASEHGFVPDVVAPSPTAASFVQAVTGALLRRRIAS